MHSDAIASQESVRITPSLRSQKGSIWSKLGATFDWWEVEVHFRVTGRGRVGADGLAFWYTQNRGLEGPVSLPFIFKWPYLSEPLVAVERPRPWISR
jgi:hypothetical protein